MNKICSLKYNHHHQFIAVSELCSRRKSVLSAKKTPPVLAALLMTVFITTMCTGVSVTYASIVSSEIPYQTYRDFAENKGQFIPGATSITIYDKSGNITGILNKAPVPDFSSANSGTAVATLFSPQYIASVWHNTGYQRVSFGNGQNDYRIVDRNNHAALDFHAPRLNKIVTEVTPASISEASQAEIRDSSRFTAFYRIGSGSQLIQHQDGKNTMLADAYHYLTGGTIPAKLLAYGSSGIQNYMGGNIDNFPPLGSFGQRGDSGSPLFGWDAKNNKWVIIGVFEGLGGGTNPIWILMPTTFTGKTLADDNDVPVFFDAARSDPLNWTFDPSTGTGSLARPGETYFMHGQKGNDLNAGKNLIFEGENGKIILHNDVIQGAGSLTFNTSYSIGTDNNSTWTGGGIDVAKDAVLSWALNGVKGDKLHKIGAGTLKVKGTGINEGGLKTGDGTVILFQQPDENGKIQAFSTVNIASGRATVVLSDNKQINPDNISWGFRGGVLDINGNDITFHKINAADNGAVITNSSATASLLTISPVKNASVIIHDWNKNKSSGGEKGWLYKYENKYTNTVDYFIQHKKYYGNFPIDQSSNNDWEYAGHDEQAAKKRVLSGRPKGTVLFHGNLSGNINVIADTSGSLADVAFDGNIHIPQGTFSRAEGHLTFQGHPVIHAYNKSDIADKLKSPGDDSISIQPVSFDQPDWETRTFTLKTLALKDTDFRLARNALLTGDINAVHSTVTLGSPALYIDLNDGNGTEARVQEGNSVASNDAGMSDYRGNVTLNNQSLLNIREKFSGRIVANDSSVSVDSAQAGLTGFSQFNTSVLTLNKGAHLSAYAGWYNDSTVAIADGARLTLSAKTVTAEQPDVFAAYYISKVTDLQGDHATVHMTGHSYSFGDITSRSGSRIVLGEAMADLQPRTGKPSEISRFNPVYGGAVSADRAEIQVNNAHWLITGNSAVQRLQGNNARFSFADRPQTEKWFTEQAGTQPPAHRSLPDNQPGDSAWQPYRLAVDTLNAQDSIFVFRVDPYREQQDQLTVNTQAAGGNNRLLLEYISHNKNDRITEDQNAAPAKEHLLVSAPLSTAADYFISVQTPTTDNAANSPWRSGLAVISHENQRQWWQFSMNNLTGWHLTKDRQFDLLSLPENSKVALSSPDSGWKPRTLQTETMIASGVHFSLTARPQSGESDRINISKLAAGGDNSLDLTLLLQADMAEGRDLLLATAPFTTADSYFSVGSLKQGLNLYIPNLTVSSTNTDKQWRLLYKPVPDGGSAINAAPDVNAESDINAAPAINTEPDRVNLPDASGTAAPPVSILPPAITSTPPAATSVSGIALFTRFSLTLSDLNSGVSTEQIATRLQQAGITPDSATVAGYQKQLAQVRQDVTDTGLLAGLPHVSFVLETNQLNKRLGDVRQLNADSGFWMKSSYGRADYQQMRLKHTTLQMGFDHKNDRQLYGIMASYTKGSGQGVNLSENHTTGGAGVYYTWLNNDGLFVDIIAKYLKNHQNYIFPASLQIAGQGVRSTSLLASVQTGWHATFINNRVFVEPAVEVVAGHSSGYTLHGSQNSVDIRLNASNPVYAKTGIAAGVNLVTDEQQALTLAAGVFRLQNLRRNSNVDILNNTSPDDVLRNPATTDNRYLTSIAVNARLSANWRIYSLFESSFSGHLKNDYSGQFGVRYQF